MPSTVAERLSALSASALPPGQVADAQLRILVPRFSGGFPTVFDGFPNRPIRKSLGKSEARRFSPAAARLKNRENRENRQTPSAHAT